MRKHEQQPEIVESREGGLQRQRLWLGIIACLFAGVACVFGGMELWSAGFNAGQGRTHPPPPEEPPIPATEAVLAGAGDIADDDPENAQTAALLERIDHDIAHTIFHVAPAGQADAAGVGPRLAAVDTKTTTTVLSKAAGARTSGASQEAPTVDPSAPRWARRQAARGAGGSKKSRKRKGSGG